MESLNDIIQRSVEANRRMFEHKGISVELDLDPHMPKLYPDFTLRTPLNHALTQFNLEVEDAKASRALYKTRYEGEVQRLTISHNGNKIQQWFLNYFNDFLKDIAEGKRKWTHLSSGNLIAGQAIKEYGGRIQLENIDEEGYKVRTTMQIPVKVSPE